jgi:CelD/BcsL family acetyltransferase involved in cellulose biosynthesis
MAALRIEEVCDEGGFLALEGEWRALFDATADATPFQSWEWLSSWWKHAGGGRPWVLIAREGAAAVGAMALVQTRYRGTPLRQVRWMGAPLSDYQDFVGPERRDELAAAFLAHLSTEKRRWDICDLNDIREGTALTGVPKNGLSSELELHRLCPVIALPATWDAYRSSLSKNQRANIGRRRRQLEKTFGATLSTVAAGDDLRAAMEDLYSLHGARWNKRGVGGAFAAANVRAMHHEVAEKFLARGWLKLHRLTTDGNTRAAFYCFQGGARVYYYLSGFDPELFKFSPGNVLMAYSVERAIADGAREFDLLRGDETYKYAWNAEDRKTQRLVLGHGSLRSRFAVGGHRFERFVEHRGLELQRRLWGRKRAPARDGDRLRENDA